LPNEDRWNTVQVKQQSINQSSDTNDTDENTTAKKYIYVWKQ
jgi:hypothetical protein